MPDAQRPLLAREHYRARFTGRDCCLSRGSAREANESKTLQACVRHKPPNARHHLPRTQRNRHSSLADESRAIRGQVHAVVRHRVQP